MTSYPAAAEHVRSPDGTRVALWRSGHGRPLVALHGVTIDHSAWDGVRPALEQVATLIAVDRRGHGASDQDRPPIRSIKRSPTSPRWLQLAPLRWTCWPIPMAGWSRSKRPAWVCPSAD